MNYVSLLRPMVFLVDLDSIGLGLFLQGSDVLQQVSDLSWQAHSLQSKGLVDGGDLKLQLVDGQLELSYPIAVVCLYALQLTCNSFVLLNQDGNAGLILWDSFIVGGCVGLDQQCQSMDLLS